MPEDYMGSNTLPPASSSDTVPVSPSHSQLSLSDTNSKDDLLDTFQRHADDILRCKIAEKLKHFSSRGILDIQPHVGALEETPLLRKIAEMHQNVRYTAM